MRKYLKKLREQSNLKQVEIAKALNISESYYSLIENGCRLDKMSIDIAKKLSLLFNVPVEVIISEEQQMKQATEPLTILYTHG